MKTIGGGFHGGKRLHFPGHMIGASLKMEAVYRRLPVLHHFPGHMIGASLKTYQPLQFYAHLIHFPGHMIGASLKRVQFDAEADALSQFPRSYDRGLIEET